ncbi:parallel beta-helix domain-containing protein [Fibrella forsythiae]|uniref:Right-handed parallel beta-helix repeat-containing protein n=1 Tax=Fibrella forsythiae TaxID=2817061 RepID=A0ABS3JM67_9BACT|nr:parallel beta-helix domain-containing protein [Fibrella forsythiae]MBO0951098.1 right-handed parallel beta-helix repeat-containing protein [Fibrella forsythiae]
MKLLFILFTCLCCLKSLAQPAVQKRIQTQLIMADNGSTIDLDAGTFIFTGSLSMEDKKRIIIRGKGVDKTILSFKGQTDGAEGLRVSNAEAIVIEDMTIQDTKGDAIKTMNVKGITFRNVKVEWTGPPSPENGSYGLYPVQCDNVMIDKCISIGASDAGIYVGQSRNIVVKNCVAHHNVAGIEIENSRDADVFDNEAYDNTGGVLVFDLPDLVQKQGGNVRVFNNNIHDNNLPDFAPAGNIVASVSDGTGLLILATNNVEVFNNRFLRNQTMGTGIISYLITERPITDKGYYPYPTAISIHDNVYERNPGPPSSRGRYNSIFKAILKEGQAVPHILYDGIVDPGTLDKAGKPLPDRRICIRNNKNQSLVNLDAGRGFKNASLDAVPFDCQLTPLKNTAVNERK